MPPPLLQYCEAQGWSLFHFRVANSDQLIVSPVLPEDAAEDLQASLGPDGKLWIPAELRQRVSLGEQSVMLRLENGAIGMYLRKVFDTLGFRPT
jgi:hypothetical protein